LTYKTKFYDSISNRLFTKEVEALLFAKTAHIKVLLSAKASG